MAEIGVGVQNGVHERRPHKVCEYFGLRCINSSRFTVWPYMYLVKLFFMIHSHIGGTFQNTQQITIHPPDNHLQQHLHNVHAPLTIGITHWVACVLSLTGHHTTEGDAHGHGLIWWQNEQEPL